jgi:methionine aminopeptidase
MATETQDKRELIAEDINGFLAGLGVPSALMVKAEDLTLTDTGVRVSKKIGDVSITVDVGQQSLMHLAMVRGFIDTGKALLGRP